MAGCVGRSHRDRAGRLKGREDRGRVAVCLVTLSAATRGHNLLLPPPEEGGGPDNGLAWHGAKIATVKGPRISGAEEKHLRCGQRLAGLPLGERTPLAIDIGDRGGQHCTIHTDLLIDDAHLIPSERHDRLQQGHPCGQRSYGIPGSYQTRSAMSAPSNAVPRLRTLDTNAKKLRGHQYKTSSHSTTLESNKSDRLLRIDCMTSMCYARREGCCGMETCRSGQVLPCGENRRTNAEGRKQAPASRRYGRRIGSPIQPCYRGRPS
jgi:hypothetical protein